MKRNINLELLRIVSMLMIIASHYCVHGYDVFGYEPASDCGEFVLNIARLGGRIGVTLFVILSGYFLSASKEFKFAKILRLWLTSIFYFGILLVVWTKLNCEGMPEIRTIINQTSLFSSHWWFVSTYLAMFLFYPAINFALKIMGQRKHVMLVLLFVAMFLYNTFWVEPIPQRIFNELLWFVALYVIAAYIRYYSSEKLNNLRWSLVVTFISAIFLVAMCAGSAFFDINILRYRNRINVFGNPFITTFAVGLFLCFRNMTAIKNKVLSRIILLFSSAAFGVYMIHDNQLVWKCFWIRAIGDFPHTTTGEILLDLSACVFGIYFVSALIDLCRIYLIEKPLMPIILRCGDFVHTYIKRLTL